jgi:type IV secretion system protein VirD4
MANVLDSISQSVVKPFAFLAKKGAFPLLLALLCSVFAYSVFKAFHGNFWNLLQQYISSTTDWLIKLSLLLIFWGVLCLLLMKSPLKALNHGALNVLSCLILLCLVCLINKVLAVIIGIIVLLLLLYKSYRGDEVDYDFTFNPYGDARWASYSQLSEKKMLATSMDEEDRDYSFILGRTKDDKANQLIAFSGEGHMLTVAKTGAGKGVSVVIPNLLHYKGSAVVIDPKGENFLKTHFHRENGFGEKNHEISLVDPFGEVSNQIYRKINKIEAGVEKVHEGYLEYLKELGPKCTTYGEGNYRKGFNPMQLINNLYEERRFDEIYDEANVLADMLVVKNAAESDPHWNEKARSFIRGAILFVTFSSIYADIPKDLLLVRQCIFYFFKAPSPAKNKLIGDEDTEDDYDEGMVDNLQLFIEECERMDNDYYPYLKGVAGEVSIIAGDERNSVLSNVLRHTEFLDSPMVAKSIARNDCRTDDIKKTFKTIYLVLPANKLNSYNRLSRLWINCVLQSIAADTEITKNRVLFMLDEMAQLGFMEPLLQAVSLMRGYGMNLWMVFQDFAQIKGIYGDKWQTFVANSRIQQFFGITDNETTDYVSKLLGQMTMTLRSDSGSKSTSKGAGGRGSSESWSQSVSHAGKPLLYPDQIRRMDYQILIADGLNPIKASRVNYFDDPEFIRLLNFPQPKQNNTWEATN